MDYPIRFSDQLKHQLRSLRKARGLTQAELGQRLGVTQARVAEIEATPGAVGFDQILKVLSALGTELFVRDVAALAADANQDPATQACDPSAGPDFIAPLPASARHLLASLNGEAPQPEAYLWPLDETGDAFLTQHNRRRLVEQLARAMLVNPRALFALLQRDVRPVPASASGAAPVPEIQRQWATGLGVAPAALAQAIREALALRGAPAGLGRQAPKGTW
jgi:HTH-type transcriptional regulator/antitoxin HipB